MKVENLFVYQKLCTLFLEVHNLSLVFPKHETYELGSQLRRSSNSCPANLAEGFGNKHTNIYTESISRSQGEIRETIHHLRMASSLGYLNQERLNNLVSQYDECLLMLYGLEKSLVLKRK
jgi:four helix bundle protein